MTNKFKDALDEYTGDFLDFYNGPPSKETDAAIRKALKIADRLDRGIVSEEMVLSGIGVRDSDEDASTCHLFRAMIEQMISELDKE